MKFVDTHCHIHFADYPLDKADVVERANKAGVEKIIVVGTTLADSEVAADFAAANKNIYAALGVHPHEASAFLEDKTADNKLDTLLNKSSFIAVGEIGLDYVRDRVPREAQMVAFPRTLIPAHRAREFHRRLARCWLARGSYSA